MKKNYEAMSGQYARPKFAVVNVAKNDMICTSHTSDGDGDGEGDGDGMGDGGDMRSDDRD